MIWDTISGEPHLTAEALLIPQLQNLKKSIVEFKFTDVEKYLYYVYSFRPYRDVLLTDRKKMVVADHSFSKDFHAEKLEKNKEFISAKDKLRLVEYSSKERYVDNWNNRVDQILQMWNKTKVTAANIVDETKIQKGIKDMLLLRKEIDSMIDDKESTDAYGGMNAALFELPSKTKI